MHNATQRRSTFTTIPPQARTVPCLAFSDHLQPVHPHEGVHTQSVHLKCQSYLR
jgi:hypothetical protein